jgi:hypothetical protein
MEALHQFCLSEEEDMTCLICRRESKADFCERHAAAKERLEAAYSLWVKACGDIKWPDYLDNVKRNVQTGLWAKEVAEFLRGG